jgi:hypothetical protein
MRTVSRADLVRVAAAAGLVAALGACASLSDDDRAQLNQATSSATQAREQSAQALAAAQSSQQLAQRAAAEAQAADSAAKAANEKADRVFARAVRK